MNFLAGSKEEKIKHYLQTEGDLYERSPYIP